MTSTELIFKQLGIKSTSSRLEVAAVLASNQHPLSHQDILKQLPASFDRVTLYRVLDWLLQHSVVHRVAGEDRIWRFQLNAIQSSPKKYSSKATLSTNLTVKQHNHAHFQCADCGKVFCLDDVKPKFNKEIPAGFIVESIELNIKGKCVNCN